MKTALFTNFSNESFTGYWNGKGKKFEAGQSLWMPDYLARHFAKHLTNRELLKKGLENATSPKRPEDVPAFMELFNQSYTPDSDDEISQEEDNIETQINVANRNREKRAKLPDGAAHVGGKEPQVLAVPTDDEDDEESFGGKPVEPVASEEKTN